MRQLSPWRSSWRVLRHCCCTLGAYPVLLAPIITAAAFFSAYSAVGCEFVQLKVGFTPSNAAWNTSSISLGMFYHKDNMMLNQTHQLHFVQNQCTEYSDLFEEDFMSPDRTWKVARIMTMLAGSASVFSSLVAWGLSVLPLPASFWPCLLLPSVMIAFITEGSKFLLFDVSMCRNALWFPSGVESLPTTAESCSIGTSAVHSIVAAALMLSSLLIVCLHAPIPRELDPDYGIEYGDEPWDGLDSCRVHGTSESHDPLYGQSRDEADVEVASNSIPEENQNVSNQPPSVAEQDRPEPDLSRVAASRLSTMNKILQQHQQEKPNQEANNEALQLLVNDLDAVFQKDRKRSDHR